MTTSSVTSPSSSDASTSSSSLSDTTKMSVAEYVKSRGGTHAIRKILIANNGIAAVKAIRSIRKWSYETFGNDRMIEFVVMATPEDIKANAAHIHLADEFVAVPGGSNNNNYANIQLITDIADRTGVDAVWPGWGHASENPLLPELLSATKRGIVWMGPPPSAMRALGDKIGSTLIAQTASVPCMPWSGSGLTVNYARDGMPQDLYLKACVTTAAEAQASAERIGFPIMIKASEGGGGKGIRRVLDASQIEMAFAQVQGEVPGSPIFLMKLAPACRHLEVQLLADKNSEAIAVFGRDCSIQRRHQKIIEEGPVVAAPPHVWREMERSAVRLAKEVGYQGAGTVEYLYLESGEYYFLELNPRLQVEHPVTELISGVNLPAAQLQVAMGIPLHRIRGVRRMYGEHPDTDTPIDFDNREAQTLPGHVIACRITAENPDMEFQPTNGQIQELNFRSTPDVWGYFSVAAKGGVHEFSDSQFGHLFALGETREIARRNMAVALKELSIRGDIRTTVEYLRQVLETKDFRLNNINTTWLERMLAQRALTTEKPDTHLAVIFGALFRSYRLQAARERDYNDYLTRGQMPPAQLHLDLIETKMPLIYGSTKYQMVVRRTSPTSYDIVLNDWTASAEVHSLSDDGLLVLLDAKKHVVYGQEFPTGLRLTVDGKTCLFHEEYDPSQLRANVQGKLVRFLVPDGAHVEKDKPYAEVEVMKMYLTLMAPESGHIRHVKPEGSVIELGDLIAALALDDPARVKKADVFNDKFPQLRPPLLMGENTSLLFKDALRRLQMTMDGYQVSAVSVRKNLDDLMRCLRDPCLPLDQFREILSTLAGRIATPLFDDFKSITDEYAARISKNRFYWETPESFPVLELQNAIDRQMLAFTNESQKLALRNQLSNVGVTALLNNYKHGNHTYAVQVLSAFFEDYFNVEHHFIDEDPEYVVKTLRRQHNNNVAAVARFTRAHYNVARRNELLLLLLDVIQTQLTPMVGDFITALKQVSLLYGRDTASVALRARQIIMLLELPSSQQRRIAIETILHAASSASSSEQRKERLAPLVDQSQPIEDIIFSFFSSRRAAAAAMEAYIRRVYQVYNVPRVSITSSGDDALVGKWEFAMSEQSNRADEVDPTAQTPRASNVSSPAHALSRREQDEYFMRKVESVISIRSLQQSAGSDDSDSSEVSSSVSVMSSPKTMHSAVASSASALSSSSSSAAAAAPFSSTTPVRSAVMGYYTSFDRLKEGFTTLLDEFSSAAQFNEPVHVLYLVLPWAGRVPSDDQLAEYFGTFLKQHTELLESLGIRRATFIVTQPNGASSSQSQAAAGDDHPMYFTFRSQLRFSEDTLLRHIEPTSALHMQLQKLSNFDLRFVPTTNRLVHLFAAYPAAEPGKGVTLHGSVANSMQERKPTTPGYDGRRLFVRSLVRKIDSVALHSSVKSDDMALDAHPEAEVAFVEALNALEFAIGGDARLWKFNSIFLNVLVELAVDTAYVEAVIRLLAKRYSDKIRRLNVSMVEVMVNIKPSADAANSVPYRFVCTNPTGYVLAVDIYEERRDPTHPGKIVFRSVRLPSSTSTTTTSNKSFWDGQDINAPYPVSMQLQRQREVASNMETFYAYDLIPLLQQAVERVWHRRSRVPRGRRSRAHSLEAPMTLRMQRQENQTSADVNKPAVLLSWVELVLAPATEANVSPSTAGSTGVVSPGVGGAEWTLIESRREPGQNDIGMLAWRVTLCTPEYPAGRDVIFISNDITFQAGTFGPLEDTLFDLASKYARARGLPRIFMSANSGARIGLAEELRNKFQVAWVNDDASKGMQYMYLTEADYATLKSSVNASAVVVNGETRYVIQDIIGKKDGLGVENLRGSGLIAGETSLAYESIFTLTVITGRTVGIGAYLARLGQRVLQKASPAQPIILTGFNALNAVLGRPVYSSNLQLGGPEIMYTNGVSHQTFADDMDGVLKTVQWLSFVPSVRNAAPPILPLLHADPVDRPIKYTPPKTSYDTRLLLTGSTDEVGMHQSGFLDKDSFVELLGGWAKSVVVGRGRLGGLPISVVAVETRTVEQVTPADPADPSSRETVSQRAGQVWFPDSAFKTAQAIKDSIAEDLPLVIFANWRGFSGGQKDMFEEILKFGSYIVDGLRSYRQPVMVYLPPNGQLRGGAWVVVDQTINARYMEMYADESARGGVLEPEATLGVKFRNKDIVAQAHRLDARLGELDAQLKRTTSDEERATLAKQIRAREDAVFPTYYQIALSFADMHDTPGRMIAKGCLQGKVAWERSRAFFYYRLRVRLIECGVIKRIMAAHGVDTDAEWNKAKALFASWAQELAGVQSWSELAENQKFFSWYAQNEQQIEARVQQIEAAARAQKVISLLSAQQTVQASGASGAGAAKDPLVQNLVDVILKLSPEQQKQLESVFFTPKPQQ